MSWRRLKAMVVKEAWQVLRDPTALLVTFALPPLILFFMAFGVNLDVRDVRLGLVVEGDGARARELAAAFSATPYLEVHMARHRREFSRALESGRVQVVAVIPQDFDARMNDPRRGARIQIISNGSEPNSAGFMAAYVQGAFANWLRGTGAPVAPPLELEQRFWFNPELESGRVLVPGAIAIVMTIIGTLLTAMVIAREWERGTMEALMSTPATNGEIVLSKLLPYFALGMFAAIVCAGIATAVFQVPLRGGAGTLLLVAAVFLFPALGQGLLISTLAPSQFTAAELGLTSGFLPAMLLSGFVFEIQSMPAPVQWLTFIFPARYFVASLQTVFLAGDIWADLLPNLLALLVLGALLFAATFHASRGRMD